MSFKMGLLGRKLGMTQVFHEDGTALGCTVLELGPCIVTGQRSPDKHGYAAVQLGFEEIPARLVRRSEAGEVLIPFVSAIVPAVDVAAGHLVVDPPEGLLEL